MITDYDPRIVALVDALAVMRRRAITAEECHAAILDDLDNEADKLTDLLTAERAEVERLKADVDRYMAEANEWHAEEARLLNEATRTKRRGR